MKKQRINRQIITRTGRICFSTACLMILASCAARPIAQDLPSGEGTVAIKYLDSVTIDIIDDIRMKRRGFYQEALDNHRTRYSQGTQGAVDRVSTFAAAINANAQRDKSVLERYHADGERQLSALENSEELGDALLDHNKELISQTGALNDAKVKVAESDAALTEGVNAATVEGYSAVISGYQSIIEENEKELEELKKKREELNREIEGLEGEEESSKQKEIDDVQGRIDSIAGKGETPGTLQAAIDNLKELVDGAQDGADDGQSVTLSPSGTNDPLTTTGMKLEYKINDTTGQLEPSDAGGYKIAKATETKVDISQLPQVAGPDKNNTLENAIENAGNLKNAIATLADSDSDNALSKTGRLSAPPIERVRNDEAVFDYLLDGYRNTQISSAADYGGMVRRVLPFSFTFNPGRNSESGFGARVVLRANEEEVKSIAEPIARYLNSSNYTRIKGYDQHYKEAEKNVGVTKDGGLIAALLSDKMSEKAFEFYKEYSQSFGKYGLNTPDLSEPSSQRFWKAYALSLKGILDALKGNNTQGQDAYAYNVTGQIVAQIQSLLDNNVTRKESGAVLDIPLPDVYDWYQTARTHAGKLKEYIARGKTIGEDKYYRQVLAELNRLAMTMSSAGLVYDHYLVSSPVFLAKKDDKEKAHMISIFPDGEGYQAQLYQFSSEDVKPLVGAAVQPRIVENTSREHVVEIADTAKINTLLDAAIRGNEVSEQLGLTLSAELAAAVSSSSAFIKRIPYAVPINGQDLGEGKFNNGKAQTFGWRYYKTPAGVTQLGGISQSFKTTPLNSSVVVAMPEWMSTLTAEYEISPDGDSDWKSMGTETIVIPGSAIRGTLSDSKMHSFGMWVKYHISREVDQAGLPRIKNCVDGEEISLNNDRKIPLIYGSRGGEMAICGENLYGVKGLSVGGQYIHGEIQKVSNNLIYLNTNRFKTLASRKESEGQDRCFTQSEEGLAQQGMVEVTECPQECRIALLSDFGVSRDGVGCLQFISTANPIASSGSASGAKVTPTVSGTDLNAKKISFTISQFADIDRVSHYRFVRADSLRGDNAPYTEWPNHSGENLQQIFIEIGSLIQKCLDTKGKPCMINLEVRIDPPGKPIFSSVLYTIDDVYRYFNPFETKVYKPSLNQGNINISFEPNTFFEVSKIYLGEKRHEITVAGFNAPVPLKDMREDCKGKETSCSIEIKYTGINEPIPLETINVFALVKEE